VEYRESVEKHGKKMVIMAQRISWGKFQISWHFGLFGGKNERFH